VTKRALAVLIMVACTKREEPSSSSSVAATQVQVQVQPSVQPSTSIPAPTFDAIAITPAPIMSCTVTFSCGLSHPGLGSSSRTTSVDLAKCERASWSESGPYNPTSPRNPPKKTITKVAKAECDRVNDLAGSLGPADATAAMESAQIDREACSLSITCPGETNDRFRVQRQTTTGATRVEQTIRAVLGP
jgi:hypothetical protein